MSKPPVRHQLTRQELYEMIWSDPVYKVAERYGISGVALAKKCRNSGIPLPSRGYWAQLQHGKKVRRTPLKPVAAGVRETILITQGVGPRPPKPPAPELDQQIVKAIAAESLEKRKITVPDHTTRLHTEAKKMGEWADNNRPWDRRKEKTEPVEVRRRRILHALFRAIEDRKGVVTAASDVGFDVELLGSDFKMSCSEVTRKKHIAMTKEQLKARSEWERRDYNTITERTGLLRVRTNRGAGNPKDFVDSDDAPLETRLNDVMIWLLRHSISVTERDHRAEVARAEAAERARREHEAEIARWKAEEKRRAEKERVNELLDDVKHWHKAVEIRAYVKAATEALEINEEWKIWALGVADAMDPLFEAKN